MPRVTMEAVLMFGRLVEARKLGSLVTSQARRRMGWTSGAVGAMAALAAARELAMLRLRLGRVASGTAGARRRTRVGLMTLQALRVARRRAARFRRVAARAPSGLRSAVRFVTVRARGVAGQRSVLLGSVARGAAGLGRGMMRQAGMAIVAVLVPNALGGGGHLGAVATAAQAAIGLG